MTEPRIYPGSVPRVYTCRECGESFPNFGAMGNHRRSVHPAGSSGPKVRAPRKGLRVESMAGRPDPLTGPSRPDLDEPTPEPGRPSLVAPTVRITPEARTESTREAVAQALTPEVLADLLVSMSRALSEIDGAGEAGVLSKVQAAQVAVLLHDATIDLVIDRFRGDVTRFKATMGILVIVLAKGAVHARAIRDRLAERSARSQAAEALDAAEGLGEPTPMRDPSGTDLRRMSPEAQMRMNAE